MLFFVFCRLLRILEGIGCEEERIIIIARVCCVWVEFYEEGDKEEFKKKKSKIRAQSIDRIVTL
jgi:hypothetical protein